MSNWEGEDNPKQENNDDLAIGAIGAANVGFPGNAANSGVPAGIAGATAGAITSDYMDPVAPDRENVEAETDPYRDVITNRAQGSMSSDSESAPDSFAGEGDTNSARRDLMDDKRGVEES